jgi:hypothetical protein
MARWCWLASTCLLAAAGCSCADPVAPGGDAGPADAARVPDAAVARDAGRDARAPSDATVDAPDGGVQADGGSAPDAWMPPRAVTCADPAPPGADVADPAPTYSGGSCPTLAAGRNVIRSGGADRAFLIVEPAALDPSERLPVVFMWHWLGGSASGFLTRGDVQAGADEARFLAVIPESKGDLRTQWPYLTIDSDARLEEEGVFFDDMLACIAEQYDVNLDCVSSAGVSAGALFTSQLAQIRSRRLASVIVLSGGVGTAGDFLNPVREWDGAAHAMPAIVLWGGPSDWCGVDFNRLSMNLERSLTAGGHFFLECVHNCSHSQPPLVPPPGESEFGSLWGFALDHPFWLRDGESPYLATGLPANLPPWCGVGMGSATIRSGMCEGGTFGSCF